MKAIFFDFEVFPKWWSLTYYEQDTDNKVVNEAHIKANCKVITSDEIDCNFKVLTLFKEDACFIGYNVKFYDLVIGNAIYNGLGPEEVKLINDAIINPSLKYKLTYRQRQFTEKRLNVKYFDLYALVPGGSLKDKESIMGLDIQEFDEDFNDANLTPEKKQRVLKYNAHDVYATCVYFYQVRYPLFLSSVNVSNVFKIPLREGIPLTSAQLAARVLNASAGKFDESFTTLQWPIKLMDYLSCIPTNVQERLLRMERFETFLFHNKCSYGVGGFHSTWIPQEGSENVRVYAETNDEYVLINVDGASFYPSIIINFNLFSRSIPRESREFYKQMFTERMRLKNLPKAEKTAEIDGLIGAYKLILNSTYGSMGDENNPMYDLLRCREVCAVGQAILTALGINLSNIPDVHVMQGNTDGICFLAKKTMLDKVREEFKRWEEATGIILEDETEDRLWQNNVNGYLLTNAKGHVKCKGLAFNDGVERLRFYFSLTPKDGRCIVDCKTQYLINGIDPFDFIMTLKDIDKFTITAKKIKTAYKMVVETKDGKYEQVLRSNRIVAVTDDTYGKMYSVMRRTNKKTGDLNETFQVVRKCPNNVMLLNNDLSTYNFDDIPLDYSYYLTRIMEDLEEGYMDVWGKVRFGYSMSE